MQRLAVPFACAVAAALALSACGGGHGHDDGYYDTWEADVVDFGTVSWYGRYAIDVLAYNNAGRTSDLTALEGLPYYLRAYGLDGTRYYPCDAVPAYATCAMTIVLTPDRTGPFDLDVVAYDDPSGQPLRIMGYVVAD